MWCVCTSLVFLLLRLHAHSHTESLTLDTLAQTHTLISPHAHTHTHTSVPSEKQSDRVTEQRQARVSLSPLPNSALSNECVQCEVAGACTISLCNYVTRSKNQDVFSSASLSLVQFDILSILQLSTSSLDGTCELYFLVFQCLQGFVFCITDLDSRVEASWKVLSWFLPRIWEGGFKPGAAV